jgi:hypothetical protein
VPLIEELDDESVDDNFFKNKIALVGKNKNQ